jgi:hypothetical protein
MTIFEINFVHVNEQPYVVVFGTSIATNATRFNVDGLPGSQRRWADRAGASARASDCGEHIPKFKSTVLRRIRRNH